MSASPQSNASFLSKLASLVAKNIIIVSLIGAVFMLVPDLNETIIQTVSQPTRYAKLIAQPAPTPNSLPNPIEGAHLTDTWGAARSGGRRHEGIDIFAERGTEIHSTTEGIVRRVGTNQLGGNVVSIVGPGGVGHYYAHLESFGEIKKGDWVEAGEVIGYVGNTGNAKSTPPHLHYGIYTQEGAINPYPLLQKP